MRFSTFNIILKFIFLPATTSCCVIARIVNQLPNFSYTVGVSDTTVSGDSTRWISPDITMRWLYLFCEQAVPD
jgi:hypothetical protein